MKVMKQRGNKTLQATLNRRVGESGGLGHHGDTNRCRRRGLEFGLERHSNTRSPPPPNAVGQYDFVRLKVSSPRHQRRSSGQVSCLTPRRRRRRHVGHGV